MLPTAVLWNNSFAIQRIDSSVLTAKENSVTRVLGKKGLTLIEMMIVIGIIALLMAMLLPNFMRARDTASKRACMSSLRAIDQAKQQFAMECSKKDGDSVDWGDIVPHYMRVQPACPLGGSYTLELIGANPKCPIAGHQLP